MEGPWRAREGHGRFEELEALAELEDGKPRQREERLGQLPQRRPATQGELLQSAELGICGGELGQAVEVGRLKDAEGGEAAEIVGEDFEGGAEPEDFEIAQLADLVGEMVHA